MRAEQPWEDEAISLTVLSCLPICTAQNASYAFWTALWGDEHSITCTASSVHFISTLSCFTKLQWCLHDNSIRHLRP